MQKPETLWLKKSILLNLHSQRRVNLPHLSLFCLDSSVISGPASTLTGFTRLGFRTAASLNEAAREAP
jgi:hypothetical protein